MEKAALKSQAVILLTCAVCQVPFSMLAWRHRAKTQAGRTSFRCGTTGCKKRAKQLRVHLDPPVKRRKLCACGTRFTTTGPALRCRSCTAKESITPAQLEAARLTLLQHGKVKGDLPREFLMEASTEWRTRDVVQALTSHGYRVEQFKRVAGRTYLLALTWQTGGHETLEQHTLLDIHDRKGQLSKREIEMARMEGWTVISLRTPVDQPIPVRLVLDALGLKTFPSFDSWALQHGCENCKRPPEERRPCIFCKREWLLTGEARDTGGTG